MDKKEFIDAVVQRLEQVFGVVEYERSPYTSGWARKVCGRNPVLATIKIDDTVVEVSCSDTRSCVNGVVISKSKKIANRLTPTVDYVAANVRDRVDARRKMDAFEAESKKLIAAATEIRRLLGGKVTRVPISTRGSAREGPSMVLDFFGEAIVLKADQVDDEFLVRLSSFILRQAEAVSAFKAANGLS